MPKRLMFAVAILMTASPLFAQQKPELTGTISFDVASESRRIENLAVTIGDGGTGQYKAILAGDSSLPTHAIYRPRDLKPFGGKNLLPVVVFGNGGCRNGSGEFRNFLSDIASHGYLVVAIGPAGDAVVAGSEGRTNMAKSVDCLREMHRQQGIWFPFKGLSVVFRRMRQVGTLRSRKTWPDRIT